MSARPAFSGRVAIQQRVLPAYRVPLFEVLAAACAGGLSVCAGQPQPDEQIPPAAGLHTAQYTPARNRHWFNVSSPLYQCWQAGLIEWLAAWQPDVLIVEANPRYRSTPGAVAWMHRRGRPVLGWGLGAAPLPGVLGWLRQRGRTRFLRSLDGMIAYSQRGAAEYAALGFPPGRVWTAPNAAAPRPTAPPPARPDGFQGQPRVLFVGRLQARKRIDSLLQVCAGLPEALQPEVTIVGDGPARPAFEAEARRVYPRTHFAGACYGDALDAHFAWADLFVLPGTGGLAVQQAMSFGLPVVVAQGDGTQDDLVRPPGGERPANGWRISPDDPAALQAALAQALSDPARLRRMGSESYRIVAEEINLEAMAAVFVQAMQAVSG